MTTAQATLPLVCQPAVAFALKEFDLNPMHTVSHVIDQIGFSNRHFIQLFKEEVGLTPKLHRRVQRFQSALRLIGNGWRVERSSNNNARNGTILEMDWAQLALGCGYYDQAHFIRDFRTFSGLSPTAYLKARGEHLNHVPLVQ